MTSFGLFSKFNIMDDKLKAPDLGKEEELAGDQVARAIRVISIFILGAMAGVLGASVYIERLVQFDYARCIQRNEQITREFQKTLVDMRKAIEAGETQGSKK